MPGGQSRKCSLPSREFCDVVLLLISLQVLTMGEAYSLEQRVQLPDNYATCSLASSQQEKGEITLLNLLLPLLLLVGSGRKVSTWFYWQSLNFSLPLPGCSQAEKI